MLLEMLFSLISLKLGLPSKLGKYLVILEVLNENSLNQGVVWFRGVCEGCK